MMDFSFNAKTYADLFHRTMAVYLQQIEQNQIDSQVDSNAQGSTSLQELVMAMDQAIDVMARADADSAVQKDMSAESIGRLNETDITQIGQYALDILEAIVDFVQKNTDDQNRELLRLTIPVSLWVARYGGKLSQIDMLVNSLAGYANEVTDTHSLTQLTSTIREIIDACDDEIKRDIEQTNMMRPWRILNINYGIVATRSHQPELIEQAYDALITNLPHEARQFFKEGMQQMDIVGYPEEVREVVERYNKMWGTEGVLH